MKILLDTNIIFSAFVMNSKFLKNLLCLCLERKHKMFIDDYSMNELNDVLNRKKINIERNVQIINNIMDIPMINFLVTNKENWHLQKVRDVKDERIISSAISNNIDVVLTGDKDLLVLKQLKICITNPITLMSLI